MEGLSDPKERASIRRAKARVRRLPLREIRAAAARRT